jgi:hypothetical protein
MFNKCNNSILNDIVLTVLFLILADILRPFANHFTEDLFSQSFTMMGFEIDDSLKTYNPDKESHRSGKKRACFNLIL